MERPWRLNQRKVDGRKGGLGVGGEAHRNDGNECLDTATSPRPALNRERERERESLSVSVCLSLAVTRTYKNAHITYSLGTHAHTKDQK